MTSPPLALIRPSHYQILALIGLGMLVMGQHQQGDYLVEPLLNLLIGAVGLGFIVFTRPRGPMIVLWLIAIIQFVAHWRAARMWRPFEMAPPTHALLDAPELLLAGGTLLYLGSMYRYLGTKFFVTPLDPRVETSQAKDRGGMPSIPLMRPASALSIEEIAGFLLGLPLWVLSGQIFWRWLNQDWNLIGLTPKFMQVAFLVWLIVVGLLVGSSLFGYWRRAHAEPDSARMYLQEVAWEELRRDHGRMGKWLAWAKRK